MQEVVANHVILQALYRILSTLIIIHHCEVEIAESGYVIDLTAEIARLIDVLLLLGDNESIAHTDKLSIYQRAGIH